MNVFVFYRIVKRNILLASQWKDKPGIQNFCWNIESWVNSNNAAVMKDDTAAKVATVPFKDRHLVIKQYKPKTWYKAISRSTRKSKAKKSWENAHLLRKTGIDTVTPVALIQDRLFFLTIRSFFICEYIPGQESKQYFNDSKKNIVEIFNSAEKIIKSILSFHDKGIYIRDTKDTNVIVTTGKVFWVDLDAIKATLWGPIAKRHRSKDWQVFFYSWQNNYLMTTIFLDILRTKLDENEYQILKVDLVRYAAKKFSTSQSARQAKKTINTEQIASEVEKMLDDREVDQDWEKVQSAQTAIVARRQTPYGGIYCKILLPRDKWEGFKRQFRAGRGNRAVKSEIMLRAAGFRVPENLFWGSKGNIDYIVSREIDGIKFVAWLDSKNCSPQWRRKVLKYLGEEVGALHRTGFAHGDLRLNNILIIENQEKPKFYFLDNERTCFYRQIPRRQVVKNLRQINTDAVSRLSKTDRLRIFLAYQAACGINYSGKQKKRLLAEIEKRTAQRNTRSPSPGNKYCAEPRHS